MASMHTGFTQLHAPSTRRRLDRILKGGDSRWLTTAIVIGVLLASAAAGTRTSYMLLSASVGLIGAAGLVLGWPVWALIGLPLAAFLVPLSFKASTTVEVNIVVLLIPAATAAWALSAMRRGKFEVVHSKVNLPVVAFLVAALFSWLLGNIYWDPSALRPANITLVQLGQFALYALAFVAMWLAANLLTEERPLQWVVSAYLLIGGLAAVLYVLPFSRSLADMLVVEGSAHSLYWVWMAAMAGSQLLFNRHLNPAVKSALAFVLGCFVYLLIAGATLGWVSGFLPFTVVIFVLLLLRYTRWAVPLFLGAAVVILINWQALFTDFGFDRELEISGMGRVGHWRIVWEFVRERPLFGLGMAAYRHYSWSHPGLVTFHLFRGANVSTHNNYYDIFAFMGVVGLGVFFWFLITYGRMAWRTVQRVKLRGNFESAYAHGVFAGFLGTVVSGMLGDWFLHFVYNIGFVGFRSSVFGWVFMGGLIALSARLAREEKTGEPGPLP